MPATVLGTHGSGDHASRPAGNTVPDGSLYSCTDHDLIYVSDYAGNSWATWASLTGTGLADPMTTRGDIIVRNASNVTDRLGIGAAGFVLRSDGTDPSWGYPALTAPIEYTLGAAVTLTTAGSYYQGPNGTPAAGSYLAIGVITFHTGGTGNRGFNARIATGGSVASGILTGYTAIDDKETDAPSASGNEYQCTTWGLVTLNGSTTISLIGASATATVDTMRRNPQSNTPLALNRATVLTLIRYA